MSEILHSKNQSVGPRRNPQVTLTRAMRAALAVLLLAPACDIEGCIADLTGLSPGQTPASTPPAPAAPPPFRPQGKESISPPPPVSESESEIPQPRRSSGPTRFDFTELTGFRASCPIKPKCRGREIDIFDDDFVDCVDQSGCTPSIEEIGRGIQGAERRRERERLRGWCKDIDNPDSRKFFECPPK